MFLSIAEIFTQHSELVIYTPTPLLQHSNTIRYSIPATEKKQICCLPTYTAHILLYCEQYTPCVLNEIAWKMKLTTCFCKQYTHMDSRLQRAYNSMTNIRSNTNASTTIHKHNI